MPPYTTGDTVAPPRGVANSDRGEEAGGLTIRRRLATCPTNVSGSPGSGNSGRGRRRNWPCPGSVCRRCGRSGSWRTWLAGLSGASLAWHFSQLKGLSIWVWQTMQSAIWGMAARVTWSDSCRPRWQASQAFCGIQMAADIAGRLQVRLLVDRRGDHRRDVAHLEVLRVAEMRQRGSTGGAGICGIRHGIGGRRLLAGSRLSEALVLRGGGGVAGRRTPVSSLGGAYARRARRQHPQPRPSASRIEGERSHPL